MAKEIKKVTGLAFAQAEEIMKNDTNSQLFIESKSHHIALSPKYLGDIKAGVTEELDKVLTHYDKSLGGVPLAYKNVKAKQQLGRIVADQPCVHFDVVADFILFKPTVGCTLKGTVHSIDKKYAACLVHQCFNAWFLQTQGKTTGAKQEPDKSLLGREVEFRVDQVFTGGSIVSIHGTLLKLLPQTTTAQDIISSMTIIEGKNLKKTFLSESTDVDNSILKTENQDDAVEKVNICVDEQSTSSGKKKKKKKKHKKESEADILVKDVKEEKPSTKGIGNETITDAVTVVEEKVTSAKKKKKKRKSDVKEDGVTSETNGLETVDVVLKSEDERCSVSDLVKVERGKDVDVNRNVVHEEVAAASKHNKRKRKHDNDGGNDGTIFNIVAKVDGDVSVEINGDIGNGKRKKVKKQKRKHEKLSDSVEQIDESPQCSVSKKKKRDH